MLEFGSDGWRYRSNAGSGFAHSGVWKAAVVLIGQRFRGAELSSAYVAGGILYGIGSIAGPLRTGLAH